MLNLKEFEKTIDRTDPYRRYGKVLRVVGLMIESNGPTANIGEVCLIYPSSKEAPPILAEVVGFNHERIILMPYSEVTEIGQGCLVESTGKPLTIPVGFGLIGKVIDPLGRPLDQSKLPEGFNYF